MNTETTSPKISKNINDLIDFSQLILGFSSAALLYLDEKTPGITGESNSNSTGENASKSAEDQTKRQMNLALAKYNIDIIELLQQKSNGNLTPEEDRLIKQVLTDLRLKYSILANHT